MAIVASVRARLLGMRLLEIDADVTVSPSSPRVRVRARRTYEIQGRPAPPQAGVPGGPIGQGLEATARSLEKTVAELDETRREMPRAPSANGARLP